MKHPILLKSFLAVFGIGLIICILSLSIARQVLYAPSPEELQSRREISVSERLRELSTWPPTPDTPLYPLRMVHDQARLLTTPSESLPNLKFELARDRLDSAEKLLARHRTSLALTTLTKSTKYLISAVAAVNAEHPQTSNTTRAKARGMIRFQIEQLTRIKESFSDEQKSVIDRLLLELNALNDQFV